MCSNMPPAAASGGGVVTHLQVQGDGEENKCSRHSHVSSEQQQLFACSLNYHELQNQKDIKQWLH